MIYMGAIFSVFDPLWDTHAISSNFSQKGDYVIRRNDYGFHEKYFELQFKLYHSV